MTASATATDLVSIESLLYPEIPEILLDPTKRHDCLFLFDVENGNPNGDPDFENSPRMEHVHNRGLVTDGCIKAKMRRYFAESGREVFIQPDVALNTHIRNAIVECGGKLAEVDLADCDHDLVDDLLAHAAELSDFEVEGRRLMYTGSDAAAAKILKALTEGLDRASDLAKALKKDLKVADRLAATLKDKKGGGITDQVRIDAEEAMVRRFADVRLFGGVMSTGLNAGQRRGPVQVVPASSIDPIKPVEMAITRRAKTTDERLSKSKTEMGRRSMLTYALYRGSLFYNAPLGIRNGVTRDDMRLMWESLLRMFSLDHASGRGMLRMRGLYVWSHSDKYGRAPYERLFDLVSVRRAVEEDARDFGDYEVSVRELAANPLVSFTRLVG